MERMIKAAELKQGDYLLTMMGFDDVGRFSKVKEVEQIELDYLRIELEGAPTEFLPRDMSLFVKVSRNPKPGFWSQPVKGL